MKKLSTALVILDKPKHAQTALDRALKLQASSGAHLHLVTFCWNAMCDHKDIYDAHQRRTIKKEILRQREAWLWDQIRDRGLNAADMTVEVVWSGDISSWVAEAALRGGYDVVVKSVHHSKTLMHTPLDWELIRSAPVPLLLVSTQRRKAADNVLATIDLRHNDRKHRTLNLRVLDAASTFASLQGGKVHCVAVVEYSEVLRDLDILDVRKVRRRAVEKTADLLDSLVTPYDIPAARIHQPAGKVGQMVSATARKTKSGLIVVGSAARRGLEANLLGGSAEKILNRSPCDVLTVHP